MHASSITGYNERTIIQLRTPVLECYWESFGIIKHTKTTNLLGYFCTLNFQGSAMKTNTSRI